MKAQRVLCKNIAALLLASAAAQAAPDILTGISPAWEPGGNWSMGVRPGIGDNAVINAEGTVDINGSALGGTTEIQDFTFDTALGATLSNEAAGAAMDLALNGGRGAGVPLIQSLGNTTYTIQGTGSGSSALRLVLKASGDVNVGSTDPLLPLTVSSVIVENGGARNLRKTGPGRLVLGGANTFTGGVTIAEGIVETGRTAGVSGLGTGVVTFTGGTLQVRENGTSSGVTLTYGNNLVVGAGGGSINADRISGTNTLIVVQFGTLSIGAQTLNLSAGSNYRVRFAGATTLSGDATLNVGSGGASPMQVFMNGAIGGGAFGLTKSGIGSVTLSAANTFTGTMNINGGGITLTGAGSLASPRINVAAGATFTVSGVTGGYKLGGTQTLAGAGTVFGTVTALNSATLQPGGAIGAGTLGFSALTLGQAAGDLASVNFASLINAPRLNVSSSNGLIANGGANSVTINIGGGAPAVGTYTMVKYLGAIGGAGFGAFRLGSLPTRLISAALVDNAANTSIDLNVTAIDFPIWTGALDNEWTAASQAAPKNWVLNSNNATSTDFLVDDNATFTDLATRTTVNIGAADVSPGAVIFNNSTKDFTITGAHGIAGIGGLQKSGAGKVTIATTNSFAGPVTLTAGTVSAGSIGDIGVASGLGAGGTITINGGTLEYTGPAASTNRTVSVGVAGATISAADSLAITSAVAVTGQLTVASGTLELGAGSTLGSAAITTNGALRLNSAGAMAINNIVSGTGGLSLRGGGTFTIGGAGANAYAGTTEVSNATLIAGKGAGVTAIPGDIILNAGGTFRYLNNNVSNQIADGASIFIHGGIFGDPFTTGPTDPGATDTVTNVVVDNGGWFASGRNVTPGPFTITGTLHVAGGGVALAQRGGIISANAIVIGDGSVNLDGGSTTANAQSRLDVGPGGLTLSGGTINFNSGPSAVGGASQGSIVRLGGDVVSTGASQLVRMNPFVSNATLDLLGATRTFNVEGTLEIGALAAQITVSNGSIDKTGGGTLTISGPQNSAALTASGGTTVLNTALGTGAGTITANAAVNLQAAQTLASLDIGAQGVITVIAPSPAPSDPDPAFAAIGALAFATVPEPGGCPLLWLGGCAVLSRWRGRRNG
jgi:autotransporter-associated beta strand protein